MARRKLIKPDPLMSGNSKPMPNAMAISRALAPLDGTARSMELKWGVGRLPELVSPETAAKFGGVQDTLNDLIGEARDVAGIATLAATMQRAWVALDAEATKAGQRPIEPVGWCFSIGNQRAIMVRTDADADAIRQHDPKAEIWTLAKAGNAIHALMKRDAPNMAEIFDKPALTPEALNPSPFNEVTGDAIPF